MNDAPLPIRPRVCTTTMKAVRLILFACALMLCVSFEGHPAKGWAATRAQLVEDWGIELQGIRRTAAGYMLDFRYQVVDPEKAKPVFERRTKPVLIHEATGARFIVPASGKIGPLRNSNLPRKNRGYVMMFANPGQFIKAGDKVTVEIGDFRAEHIVVQ